MILLPLIEEQLNYLSKHNLLKKFKKAKELFEINIYHPSLNIEILEPKHLKMYSFRLDKKYRVVFVILDGNAKVVSITNHYK